MCDFNEGELIELSNKRKLDRLFSKVDSAKRYAGINPSITRYGLLLKDKLYGPRVYLSINKKSFKFSFHKSNCEINDIINIINEMQFEVVWEYFNKR